MDFKEKNSNEVSDCEAIPSEDYGRRQSLEQKQSSLQHALEELLQEHFTQVQGLLCQGSEHPVARRAVSFGGVSSRRTTINRAPSMGSNSIRSRGQGSVRSSRRSLDGGDFSDRRSSLFQASSMHSFASLQVRKEATARATTPYDLEVAELSGASSVELPRFVQRLVVSHTFEWASAFLILSNAIFFGVEAQYQATSTERAHDDIFAAVADAYTALFTLELLVRMYADGRSFICSRHWLWNLFDTFIVIISLAELLFPQQVPTLSFMRIVRLTRTFRLYRTVQYLRVFTGLRILVSSVLNTLRSLAWTVFLLASILYVFGLLFTQTALIYNGRVDKDPEVAQGLQEHFGSLLRAVATLFKCITNGISWERASKPLGAVHPLWELAFCLFVSFTCLAVLNVVTGVFCQSAIESANRDKDGIVQHQLAMGEKYVSELKQLFRQMDQDHSGIVTLTTFEESLKDSHIKAYFDGLDMSCDDAWNLFKLLDCDESNGVDLEEFVQGCLKLQGSARSIDTHMLIYESRWAMKRLHEISAAVQQIGELCSATLVAQSISDNCCWESETAALADEPTLPAVQSLPDPVEPGKIMTAL